MIKSIIVALGIFAACHARIVKTDCQDGASIIVNNIKHTQEVLKKNIESPYQLAMDYDTNTIFFSYNIEGEGEDTFRSAFINLKTNEFDKITGIKGGFANAVDGRNHIVYLGGSDGIYKYDFETKTAHFKTAKNINVWGMFFKDKLYFTTYPHETVYVYENGESKPVNALANLKIRLVAVDKLDNLLYANESGLFQLSKEGTHFELGEYNVNGFTADFNGNLFFSTPQGIFSIDTERNINKLATMDSVYGLAIDVDQSIIYAADDKIIRLKSTGIACKGGEHTLSNEEEDVQDNDI